MKKSLTWLVLLCCSALKRSDSSDVVSDFQIRVTPSPTTPVTTSPSTVPTTPPPTEPPEPTLAPVAQLALTLQDVNVLIVTDVHSWVAGHNKHQPELDLDYGDVLSFYTRLQRAAADRDRDLLFVMNGDFMHGSALSQNPPEALVPILAHMPWDLVTLGNHDLELKDTIDYLQQPGALVDSLGPALVTSNVLYGGEPFGNRYRFITLPRAQQTLLCFGFIYNMQDNDPAVTIEQVADVLESAWFTAVLQQPHDAILILAHMDVQDALVKSILAAIRAIVGPSKVVQFVTGHTHQRAYVPLDPFASSLQAGFYLDTLGFVSFQTKSNETTFYHSLMDANQKTLLATLDVPNMNTDEGEDLSNFIHSVADSLDANRVIGCAPRTYYLDKAIAEHDSLHGLYLNHVLPTAFLDRVDSPPGMINAVVLSLPYFLRYNLFQGEVTVNDIHNIISDDDVLYRVAHSLRGDKIQRLAGHLAGKGTYLNGTTPSVVYTIEDGNPVIKPDGSHELFVLGREKDAVAEILVSERVRHPLADLVDGGETTIISLWIDFISNTWECGRDPGYNDGGDVGGVIPVADENNDILPEETPKPVETEPPKQPVEDNTGDISVVGPVFGAIFAVVGFVILLRAVPAFLRRRRRQKMRTQHDIDDPVMAIDHVIEIT